jgi:molecular chaperone HscB
MTWSRELHSLLMIFNGVVVPVFPTKPDGRTRLKETGVDLVDLVDPVDSSRRTWDTAPMTSDPFSLLGIPVRFRLDRDDLQRRATRMASRLHPDRAPDAIAAATCTDELATVHAAVRLLEDDLGRAEALLAMRGGPGPGEDHGLPDGFLESMLEIRMELEEAHQLDDEVGRSRLEIWAKGEWDARREAVEQLFDGDAADSVHHPGSDHLVEIRRELNRWRYSQRMLEQIDPGMNALDL